MNEKIEFHFKGGIAEQHQLPIKNMLNLLSNVEDLIYLLISNQKGLVFNERFRPNTHSIRYNSL